MSCTLSCKTIAPSAGIVASEVSRAGFSSVSMLKDTQAADGVLAMSVGKLKEGLRTSAKGDVPWSKHVKLYAPSSESLAIRTSTHAPLFVRCNRNRQHRHHGPGGRHVDERTHRWGHGQHSSRTLPGHFTPEPPSSFDKAVLFESTGILRATGAHRPTINWPSIRRLRTASQSDGQRLGAHFGTVREVAARDKRRDQIGSKEALG